jgi:hypothetical protein
MKGDCVSDEHNESMNNWREEVLKEHCGEQDQLDAASNEGMDGPDFPVEVGVGGLDLTNEQFVDAALTQPYDQLVVAAEELKRHQLYIIAARETVNEWERTPHLIDPRYLSVVKDILDTAERLVGITYKPND